ncbi:zinc finger protein 580-like [Trichechus inunguis]|uniref:Zinc finger protein 580-like n=1 Tax=Trichechus manatus latirostris TaxID=127582 RepID=A0A2Y9DVS1_TRIMA|nr:zinc finger protein 580-like [Trichechus manatus latirostris]
MSEPSPELVPAATSGPESLLCRAAPQVMLLPPRPPTLRSSPEAMDPPPTLQSSPEAMDPPPSQVDPLPPQVDPPPAASSPPHYYLLIDTHGVPYKYTAQRKEGRRPPAEEPAPGDGEEEGRSCPCHECGRVCSSPMQLQGHLLTHSMVRPFTCDTCDRAFKRSSDLARHRRMAHNTVRRTGTDRPYVCPYCPRRFQDTATLAEHVPTH